MPALFSARLFSARLGADFTRLWTATAVSNLGDGITMAAGPLLAASISRDPAAVAGAAVAQQLPWLLFALISGVWVDRLDRRRLIVAVQLFRAVALGGLAVTVGTGTVTVAVVYLVFFLLGTAETLADSASGALLPAVVAPAGLPVANARLGATFTVAQQFAAKPLGAWLFVVAAAAPFGLTALAYALAALLVARIRATPAPVERPPARVRADVAEGVRWLWRHRLLRTLAVSMGLGNLAFCAAFAVFVLYASERLGVSGTGFGVLLLTFAVGGLLGSVVALPVLRAAGATVLLRAGLCVEVATHLVLAVSASPWPAAAVLVVFGVHTMVWGVVAGTLRQRAVPDGLRGRVGSAYAVLDLGGAALGSLLGGLAARAWGLTVPFWAAAAVTAVIAVAAWRPLRVADRVIGELDEVVAEGPDGAEAQRDRGGDPVQRPGPGAGGAREEQ